MLPFPDTILSISGVTTYLQDLLGADPLLQNVWVTGEVSSVSRYRSGLFLTLQDPNQTASLGCVIWNSYLPSLAIEPRAGMQVIVLGRVQIYAQRSTYQMIVAQVLPGGEGLRALRYRQLRDRLMAEGLFDPTRKRPLPIHPQTIAVVTSAQAAAWGDIQRTLAARYPGLRVLLSPALVQGEQAPTSIVRAIQRVEQDGRAEVLVISRGGGASEDLECFNDERVIRAIAACSIPVLAGIGHERDESLADWAADACVHTPTAAAERVVPNLQEVWADHQDRCLTLRAVVGQVVADQVQQLDALKYQLLRLALPKQVDQQQERLQWLQQRLIQSVQSQYQQAQQHTYQLTQTLMALDPGAVLKRGYAVLWQSEGQIARNAYDLEVGAELTVQLATGHIQVQVTAIHPSSVHAHEQES